MDKWCIFDTCKYHSVLHVQASSSSHEQRRLVVGLTGYPNVGKSSTINALFGEPWLLCRFMSHAHNTSPTSARHLQESHFTLATSSLCMLIQARRRQQWRRRPARRSTSRR